MEDYIELQEIGSGSYGTVFKCRHRATGDIVAIKQMKDEEGNEQMRKTALREAKILKQLQHPNVVRLLELFRSKTRLYMVFEYMDRSILKLLENNPRGLPPMEVKKILWQLVLALNFLHGQQIIHRDLKPENILTDDQGAVKLADFGFARPQTQGGHNLSPYVATRWYRAPELLVGDTYGPGVDVWALGCLLVELATGQPLFPGKSNMDQLWLILRCVGCTARQGNRMRSNATLSKLAMPKEEELVPLEKRYAYLDRNSMALLKACLEPEPQKRPSAVQLLSHEYFTIAKTVLAPYTSAAVQATAAAKAAAALVPAPRASGTGEALPERTINLTHGEAQGKSRAHNHAHATPAATPAPQPPVRSTMVLPGTKRPSAPPSAVPATAQQPGAARQAAPAPGTTGNAADKGQAGNGSQGSDLDMHGVTGSDGGAEDEDNEYEPDQEETMSPEARAKIQRWVDAIPERENKGNVKTVLSVAPGRDSNAIQSLWGAATAESGLPHGAPSPSTPGGVVNTRQAVGTSPTSILSNLVNNQTSTPTTPGPTSITIPSAAPSGAASPVPIMNRPPSALNFLAQSTGALTSPPPAIKGLQPGQSIQTWSPFPNAAGNASPCTSTTSPGPGSNGGGALHSPLLPPRMPSEVSKSRRCSTVTTSVGDPARLFGSQAQSSPGLPTNDTSEPFNLEQMILRQFSTMNGTRWAPDPLSPNSNACSASTTPHAVALQQRLVSGSLDGAHTPPSSSPSKAERFLGRLTTARAALAENPPSLVVKQPPAIDVSNSSTQYLLQSPPVLSPSSDPTPKQTSTSSICDQSPDAKAQMGASATSTQLQPQPPQLSAQQLGYERASPQTQRRFSVVTLPTTTVPTPSPGPASNPGVQLPPSAAPSSTHSPNLSPLQILIQQQQQHDQLRAATLPAGALAPHPPAAVPPGAAASSLHTRSVAQASPFTAKAAAVPSFPLARSEEVTPYIEQLQQLASGKECTSMHSSRASLVNLLGKTNSTQAGPTSTSLGEGAAGWQPTKA